MDKILDQSNWNRKEHFDFFKEFDEPFFGIVTEVDCTKAYLISKKQKQSFFAYYLHKSICAINQVEEMRYRLIDEEIIIHNQIHASTTIGREDGTFAFTFVPFNLDFKIFKALALF